MDMKSGGITLMCAVLIYIFFLFFMINNSVSNIIFKLSNKEIKEHLIKHSEYDVYVIGFDDINDQDYYINILNEFKLFGIFYGRNRRYNYNNGFIFLVIRNRTNKTYPKPEYSLLVAKDYMKYDEKYGLDKHIIIKNKNEFIFHINKLLICCKTILYNYNPKQLVY